MKPIYQSPLFALTLFFGLGLALGEYLSLAWACLALPGALSLGYLLRYGRWWQPRHREGLAWLAVVGLMVGLGLLRQGVERTGQGTASLEPFNCQAQVLLARVEGPVKVAPWGRKATVQVLALRQDSRWQRLAAPVLAYLPSEGEVLTENDSVLLWGELRTVYSQYPGYLEYLHRRGIHYSFSVQGYQVRGRHPSLAGWARGWQQQLAAGLAGVLAEEEQLGLGLAMFLGDKQQLSQGLRADFAAAGASHVLAISGLHVGIVFLFLSVLFRPLRQLPQGKRLRSLAILVVLLLFMLITGASPAVVRAVVMLGSVLVFRIFYARHQLLNIVSLAALVQMLYDPAVIYAVGFQLSYAAVLGIVLLMPYFEKAFGQEQSWLNQLYSWIGISVVATLATAPLVMGYFGQFPTYFLLTNLLISGFLPLLMGLGFATVLLASLPLLGPCLGFLTSQGLALLSYICATVADLPHAVIDEFSFTHPGLPVLLLQLLGALLLLLAPRVVQYLRSRKRLSYGVWGSSGALGWHAEAKERTQRSAAR